jgi:peptidoglycan/xylan/chitin deacetylase (PgdA/CDA1 family)
MRLSRRLASLILCAVAAGIFVLTSLLGGGGHELQASSAPGALARVTMPARPADDGDEHAWRRPSASAAITSPGHGAKTGFLPASSPRELLLSFDDGPDLDRTPLILHELDRRGLKAIFFVTGWRIVGQRPEDLARRDLVRKLASHGHLIANHTMNHRDLCKNPAEQAAEIDGNSELVAQATGLRPLLFRAPYGAYCRSLAAALAERELVDIGWNIDPQDWKNNNEEAIFKYLTGKLSRLEGRGILLMHDTHGASVRALPLILDWIARENHRAVREERAPILLLDYSAVLPPRDVARTGLEIIVGRLLDNVSAPVERLLPASPRP